MHQQYYLVQPANAQEKLNIQPSQEIWKTESDCPPPPHSLFKGGYYLGRGGGGNEDRMPVSPGHSVAQYPSLHCRCQAATVLGPSVPGEGWQRGQ